MTSSFTRRLAVAAACAALALPVLAQTTPAAPAGSSDAPTSQMQKRSDHRADRQAQRAQWKEKRTERHAQHLSQLKTQLALTPAQEGAWTSFTQAMQPRGDFARLDRESMQKLTTPERIDRMRAQRAQWDAAMDARSDAVKAFYAQLQPEQQKTFDRMGHRMDSDRKQHMQGRHGHGPMRQGGGQPG
jgi:hypothetical protein